MTHNNDSRSTSVSEPSSDLLQQGSSDSRSGLEQASRNATYSPETWLEFALEAKTPAQRAFCAARGLAYINEIDPGIQSSLLRQLYMGHYESGNFYRAVQDALQLISLGQMLDVCHHDASRAYLAIGDIEKSLNHLRMASRVAPAERRAFHDWTLSSILFLHGDWDQAKRVITRAIRFAGSAKPLYRAQLALIQLYNGEFIDNAMQFTVELENSPSGQGYGRFVLGLLCIKLGMIDKGVQYLQDFITNTLRGRPALSYSLAGELKMARDTLSKLSHNST